MVTLIWSGCRVESERDLEDSFALETLFDNQYELHVNIGQVE